MRYQLPPASCLLPGEVAIFTAGIV